MTTASPLTTSTSSAPDSSSACVTYDDGSSAESCDAARLLSCLNPARLVLDVVPTP